MFQARFTIPCILVALALAALPAAAQAVTTEWGAEGETFSELSLAKESIALASGPMTISVPSSELTIECKSAKGTGTVLKGGTDEESLTLSECSVAKLSCKVSGSIVLTITSEGLAVGPYDKLSPSGTVNFEKGTGCTLPLSNKISGSVADETPTPEEETNKRKMVFSTTITNSVNELLKKAGSAELKLSFGESTAFLSGTLSMTMTGAKAAQRLRRLRWTKLCEVEAASCNGLLTYQATQAIKAKALVESKFKFGANTVTCTETKFEGSTTSTEGWQVWAKFTTVSFNNCNAGGCTVSPPAGWVPWHVYFTSDGNKKDGEFGIGVPSVLIVCGATVNCRFRISNQPFSEFGIFGGAGAKFHSFPQALQLEAGTCANGTFESTGAGGLMKFEFTEPSPMFIAGTT